MILTLIFVLSCNNTSNEADIKSTKKEWKIISLNGTITELIYELGLKNQLVGVDVTSTYPSDTKNKQNLGHASKLNAEAILALKPNLILIDNKNKTNPVLDQIKNSGIQIESLTLPQTLEGSLSTATQLSKLLGQPLDTKKLEELISINKAKIATTLSKTNQKPKVLFIYARGTKMMMVAGKNTFAEKIIELAGGEHIITEFESFKPLNPESLLQYQPDAILMFDSGYQSLGNSDKNISPNEALFSIPGMDKTPAGKNKNIITMDGQYISGFGPRASNAVLELISKLHDKSNTVKM